MGKLAYLIVTEKGGYVSTVKKVSKHDEKETPQESPDQQGKEP